MDIKRLRDKSLKNQKKYQLEKLKKDPDNKEFKEYLAQVEAEMKCRNLPEDK